MWTFAGKTNLHAASTLEREPVIPKDKSNTRVEVDVEIDIKDLSDFINADPSTYLRVRWIKDDNKEQEIIVFKCNVTWGDTPVKWDDVSSMG